MTNFYIRLINARTHTLNLILSLFFFLSPYQLFAQSLYFPEEVPLVEVLADSEAIRIQRDYPYIQTVSMDELGSSIYYEKGPIFLNEREKNLLHKYFNFSDDLLISNKNNYAKALEYYDYLYAAVLPNLHQIVSVVRKNYQVSKGETLEDLLEREFQEEMPDVAEFDHLKSLERNLEIIETLSNLRVSYYNCEIRMHPYRIKPNSFESLSSDSVMMENYIKVNYYTHPYLCNRLGNRSNGYWNDSFDQTRNGYVLNHLEDFAEDVLKNKQGFISLKQMIFDQIVEERNAVELAIQMAETKEDKKELGENTEKLAEYNKIIANYDVEVKDVSNVGMIKKLYTWSQQSNHLLFISTAIVVLPKFLELCLKLILNLVPRLKRIALRLMVRMKHVTQKFSLIKKGAKLATGMKKWASFIGRLGPGFYIQLGLLSIGIALYVHNERKFKNKNKAAEFFKMTMNKVMSQLRYMDFSRPLEDDYYLKHSYVFLDTQEFWDKGEITIKERGDHYHHWYLNLSDDPELAKLNFRNELLYQPRYNVSSIIEDKFLPYLEEFINHSIVTYWDGVLRREEARKWHLKNQQIRNQRKND